MRMGRIGLACVTTALLVAVAWAGYEKPGGPEKGRPLTPAEKGAVEKAISNIERSGRKKEAAHLTALLNAGKICAETGNIPCNGSSSEGISTRRRVTRSTSTRT